MTDKPPSGSKPPETREMYTEIAALVGAIAKALEIPESDAAEGLEKGAIALDFGRDANGNRFVIATQKDGKSARVYQGAIKRAKEP